MIPVIRLLFLVAQVAVSTPAPSPSPTISPTPTPMPTGIRRFVVMCEGTNWQDGVYLSRLQMSPGWTISIQGPMPACTFGTVETITISP